MRDDTFAGDLEAAISASSSHFVGPASAAFRHMTPEALLNGPVFAYVGTLAATKPSPSVRPLGGELIAAVIADDCHSTVYYRPVISHSIKLGMVLA